MDFEMNIKRNTESASRTKMVFTNELWVSVKLFSRIIPMMKAIVNRRKGNWRNMDCRGFIRL